MTQIEKSAAGIEVATELPFSIIKDGKGLEIKVINLDDSSLLPRTGIIVFESVKAQRGDLRGSILQIYTCTEDKQSGVMVGICIGHLKNGDLKWMRISLSGINSFDLSVPIERKKAIVLLRSTIVRGSPNESVLVSVPKFRVHDAEKAANLEIKRVTDGQRSVSIAMGLSGEELVNMARNLGIPTDRTSIPIMTSEVLKRAEKNPQEFLQIWENPNRELLTILNRCINSGVISNNLSEGFLYDGRFLGHNEPAVFEYFKKYPDVATTLDMKSRDKMKASEKSMEKAEPLKNRQDLDAENMALKKQLADMKAQLQEQSATSIRETLKDEKEADPFIQNKLDALKERASKFKVKGLHHYKPTDESVEKLRVKVEELEAESVEVKPEGQTQEA